jgi:hypothetical protein
MMKTDENVEKVRTVERPDRRLGIKMIAKELNMDTETLRQTLTTNLNIKKCVPKWSQRIRQFLATKQIPTPKHAQYSPDLSPRDFILSPELKSSFKGTHF